MNFNNFEFLQRGKCLIFYLFFELFIAFFITTITDFRYDDIFLIMGIILAILGSFSLFGNIHIANGANTLGQSNSQYVSQAPLEKAHHENEALDRANNALRTTIFDVKFHSLEIMLSGIVLILVSLF